MRPRGAHDDSCASGAGRDAWAGLGIGLALGGRATASYLDDWGQQLRFSTFASLVLLASGPVSAAPRLKEPVRPLLGQWVCTAWTYNGEANHPDPCVWEFGAGGKLLRRLGDWDPDPAQRRYAADPTATPARLDWTDGEDTVEAIYRVEGDTLTVCYSHNPADNRPGRFEAPNGSRLVLLTFKRVKPNN